MGVFLFVGFTPAAEGHAVRAGFVRRIADLIAEEGSTQAEAAARMGMSQPDVSKMLKGQFRPLSLERLIRCFVALGQSVTIEVKPTSGRNARPGVRVR